MRQSETALRKPALRASWLLIPLVLVLAACGTAGDDEEDHQFATDRQPTQIAATAEPTAQPPLPTAPPTESPAQLLEVRGAPQVAYVLVDGHLNSYDSNERTFTPLEIPDNAEILDFASSPTGDRVGVLSTTGSASSIQFFGSDGQPLGEPIGIQLPHTPTGLATPLSSPVATPQAEAPTVYHVSWVPQGNGVVVSGPGLIQQVSMNGTVMPVSRTGVTGTVVEAIWSPMDSQVAIQAQLANGEQAVYLMDADMAEAIEVEAFHDHTGQAISNLQWLPSGRGMMLVAGESRNGLLMNGQLYIYRFDDQVPSLVASSAQGGPGGTISHAAVSPDGHSVAYSVAVHDGDSWRLHSLWVRPTRGGPATSIPVNTSSPIETIQWTAEGLVWTHANGDLYVVDGDLVPRPLGSDPMPPEATPVGTPPASPEATPDMSLTPAG